MLSKIKKHAKKIVVATSVVAVSLATNAMAALSIDQQAVADAVDLLITDLGTWAWGCVLAMTTLFIGIKLFKKVFRAAT